MCQRSAAWRSRARPTHILGRATVDVRGRLPFLLIGEWHADQQAYFSSGASTMLPFSSTVCVRQYTSHLSSTFCGTLPSG